MAALIAAEANKQTFVAGLTWSALQTRGKKRSAEVRSLAREVEASHVVVVGDGELAAVGLFSRTEVDSDLDDFDDEGPGRTRTRKRRQVFHSLAAAFARLAGPGFALLVYTAASGDVILIVSSAGIPQADEVKNSDDAKQIADSYAQGANGFAYTVYSNDSSMFPNAVLLSDKQLWAASGRHSTLGKVPLDIVKLASMAMLALVGVTAAYGWDAHRERQRQLEVQRQQALADPTPAYLAALTPALSKVGVRGSEASRLLSIAARYPLQANGWVLQAVECSAIARQCMSSWLRNGGTTEDLLSARQHAGERLVNADQTGAPRLVQLVAPISIEPKAISFQELAPLVKTQLPMMSFAQRMEDMGVGFKVDTAGYARWPKVAGLDMASLPGSVVALAMPVELALDAALVEQVVNLVPDWIYFHKLKVEMPTGSAQVLRVGVVLTGMSHVR